MSTNPYQPPSQFSEQSLQAGPQPPAAAKVFGILNILFGALGICGIAISVVGLLIPLSPEMTKDNPALQLMEESALYRTYTQVAVVLAFVATVVEIVAGVGLLQLRPYGRTLSIGCAIYAIVMTIIGTVVNVLFVFPVLIEKAGVGGPAAAGAYGGIAGGTIGSCLGAIYPVLLLYFMFRPNMVAAFRK